MNEKNNAHHREESVYQTGNTCPPKSHRGLIAVLLVLVIFLGGIVSGLGLMNIHLFRKLQKQQAGEASFRFSQSNMPAESQDALSAFLGFAGETIPSVHRFYYQLPQGLYITSVSAGGDAAAKGVQPGDILLELDSVPITDREALEAFLADRRAGDTVHALFCRGNTNYQLTLTVLR